MLYASRVGSGAVAFAGGMAVLSVNSSCYYAASYAKKVTPKVTFAALIKFVCAVGSVERLLCQDVIKLAFLRYC